MQNPGPDLPRPVLRGEQLRAYHWCRYQHWVSVSAPSYRRPFDDILALRGGTSQQTNRKHSRSPQNECDLELQRNHWSRSVRMGSMLAALRAGTKAATIDTAIKTSVTTRNTERSSLATWNKALSTSLVAKIEAKAPPPVPSTARIAALRSTTPRTWAREAPS